MYKVVLETSAEKELKSLPKKTLKSVILKLGLLADDPRPAGCQKIQGLANHWRFRVGKYRIVYEIDDDNDRIKVDRIKHRKDVYKK